MSPIKKFLNEKYPDVDFDQLTAAEIQKIFESIHFSMWVLKESSKDLIKAVSEWVDNCKL